MPEKRTLERAREDAREGKSPSTQAGEFVREEMDHIREGKHGAASTKQAIATTEVRLILVIICVLSPTRSNHKGYRWRNTACIVKSNSALIV